MHRGVYGCGIVCAGFLLAGWVVGNRLISPQYLTLDNGPVKADALVVLGGALERAERAGELFNDGEAPGIIVSGTGDWAINTRYLQGKGVPPGAITIERDSTTTRDNAQFTIPILREMGARRVIIVTSWYHSRRALACFRHSAPDVDFFSRPSLLGYPGTETHSKYFERIKRMEVLKLVWYAIRYGVWAF